MVLQARLPLVVTKSSANDRPVCKDPKHQDDDWLMIVIIKSAKQCNLGSKAECFCSYGKVDCASLPRTLSTTNGSIN